MKSNFIKINKVISILLVVGISIIAFSINVVAGPNIVKEMVLQVNPNIITLPDNQVSKVPITVARIRSTEIRTLNKEYNAVSIEKLFKLGKKSQLDEIEIKGLKKTEKKKKEIVSEVVNVAGVFTKEIKKIQEEKGKNIVELNNVFIIQFQFEEETNITGIINAYKALPVVIHAQHIIRK